MSEQNKLTVLPVFKRSENTGNSPPEPHTEGLPGAPDEMPASRSGPSALIRGKPFPYARENITLAVRGKSLTLIRGKPVPDEQDIPVPLVRGKPEPDARGKPAASLKYCHFFINNPDIHLDMKYLYPAIS